MPQKLPPFLADASGYFPSRSKKASLVPHGIPLDESSTLNRNSLSISAADSKERTTPALSNGSPNADNDCDLGF